MMVRIIMCGCNGKMGRVISDLAVGQRGFQKWRI